MTDEIPVNPGVESITSFEVYYESEEPITSFMFTINLDNNVWEDQNTVISYLGSGYMIGSGYENTNPTVSLNALSGGAAENNGFNLSVSHSGHIPNGDAYCLDCAIVSGSSNGSSIPSGNGLLLTLEGQNVSLDGICVTAAYGESWNLDIGCVSIQECNTIVFSQYWDDCMWYDAAGYPYHPYAGLTNTTIIDTDDTDLTNITIIDNDVVNEGDIDDDDLDTQIIPLDLPEGWSMFGYTCLDSVDAMVGFSDISDKIEIVKDEWGLSYLPSWEFNAMGSLHFSEGYQIKMIEEVADFQFCEAIVQEDGITQADVDAAYANGVASVDITSDNQAAFDEGAASVDITSDNQAAFDEGVASVTPEDGITQADVDAAYANGVASVDITSDNQAAFDEGAASVDITSDNQAAFDEGVASVTPEDGITQADLDALAESYEGWCESDLDNDGICDVDEVSGCMDVSSCNFVLGAEFDDSSCEYTSCLDECGVINGDNSTCLDCAGVVNGTSEDLGCGCGNPLQAGYDCDGNELQIGDIHEGGIIFQINEDGTGLVADLQDLELMNWYDAMDTAESSTLQGYDDWYLPSLEELELMYSTIGQGGGNIGGFVNSFYWSSSEYYDFNAWVVIFESGYTVVSPKSPINRVRVIRAF